MSSFFIDFPNEFYLFNNGGFCVTTKKEILNEFKSSISGSINSGLSKMDCETYCMGEPNCWGCTLTYDLTGQWNAVTNCEHQKNHLELFHVH